MQKRQIKWKIGKSGIKKRSELKTRQKLYREEFLQCNSLLDLKFSTWLYTFFFLSFSLFSTLFLPFTTSFSLFSSLLPYLLWILFLSTFLVPSYLIHFLLVMSYTWVTIKSINSHYPKWGGEGGEITNSTRESNRSQLHFCWHREMRSLITISEMLRGFLRKKESQQSTKPPWGGI